MRNVRLASTALFLSGCAALSALATTPGWENVKPDREVFPLSETVWKADLSRRGAFKAEFLGGAKGTVDVARNGIRIRKTNDEGHIVVSAEKFSAKKGRKFRFYCDVEIPDADVDYSTGFLRAWGEKMDLAPSPLEGFNFWRGSLHTMRGMPNTAPGMTTRKYGQFVADDGVVTPAIVVAGRRSTSVWRNWGAEDHDAAFEKWKSLRYGRGDIGVNCASDRMPEADFDRMLAEDVDHVAKVERIDGVSRLVIDGVVSAPAVFKAIHRTRPPVDFEKFVGGPLDGSDVKLMICAVELGGTPDKEGYWTSRGFDAAGAAEEIKNAMRCAPHSVFLVAIGCNAYPGFAMEAPPGERWTRKNGTPVMGVHGSCVSSYMMTPDAKMWPWPSYSSRTYRDGVRKCIRELVEELKRQGLTKRIVGTHICGYHDGQFTIPYADHSEAAKAECRRLVERGGLISTNYNFVCKQTGFSAQEEFAGEFKRAIGKPSMAVIWCESPYNGLISTSLFLTEFTRSGAVDVIVAQPHYRERLPAFPITSVVPTDSFHLHGKMFWNEFDIRTYGALKSFGSGWNSPVSAMGVGNCDDFTMWQTVFRKHAGEMDALRMGYWFYDMGFENGWFSPPEIVDDIRKVAKEGWYLARRKPTAWKPGVAVVVDEGQFYPDGGDEFDRYYASDDFIYAQQVRYFVSGGAPFLRFLAEDVIDNPSLLDGCQMVVFAFMRNVDARRRRLLEHLAAKKRTLVFLSGTAVAGGADATGFDVTETRGEFSHATRPEPGVADNVMSEMDVWAFRENPCKTAWSDVWPTVAEKPGVKVLSRYVSDGKPAVAYIDGDAGRRVYVCEPGGLTPGLYNRFARESGAYVALGREGVQLNMNEDFVSLHCLRAGRYDFRLPFKCKAINMRTGLAEKADAGVLHLELTAGETCRFFLVRE